jgi:GntR family transcriptional regulator, histidine utilization repressor
LTAEANSSWQAIHAEIMRRISEREWKPGEAVPHEAELARQFGCARATVNRAMRQAADNGFLERRRKAGTRVASHPVRKARLEIPVTRLEVEGRGQHWRHELLEHRLAVPPGRITSRLELASSQNLLQLRSRHFADGKPFLHEDRWINPAALPQALQTDFSAMSANEWLVLNAPFTRGDIALSAAAANAKEARLLETVAGAALFIIERITWNGATPVTHVRLAYAPGYTMNSVI